MAGREPWYCKACGFCRVEEKAHHNKKHSYDAKQTNAAIEQKNLKKNNGKQVAKGEDKPSKSGKRNNICN